MKRYIFAKLNTAGGGQDKQLSELIEITSLEEQNKNIYFIAFLDGKYANEFFNHKNLQPKLQMQRSEVLENLTKYSNNYFVNTAGFKKLFR
jgi:hypothetical protein